MPFFIKKGGKRTVNQKSKVRGRSKAVPSSRNKKNLSKKDNEELSEGSDEELPSDDEFVGKSSDSDSELERETPQEKRLRLAKEYLNQVEEEIDEAADSEDDADGLMAQRLKHDASKLKGKHFTHIADDILSPESDDIVILRGHQLSLTCLVISPDNKYIYTGSKDCSIIKWNVELKKKVITIHGGRKGTESSHKGHTSHVLSMAISTTNKYLVSGDQTALILVWNPESMDLLHTFKGHKGPVTGLAFRRGCNELFSASADKSVKVWSLDEMAYVETVFGHQDAVTSIDAMMRERAVSVGGRDNTVRVWKIVEESQFVYNGPGGSMDCVCLIDEEKFVTGSDTNQICVWKVMKKRPVATVNNAHEGDGECWINALRALRNTDLLASGSKTGQIKLWKIPDFGPPKAIHVVPMPGFVNDLHFATGGKFLAAAVGQEHKLGRWWRLKEAKNCLAIINLPKVKTKSIVNA
ncbi:U3 small nucleolar RNA-interacting protein 2-like isoform X2 [Watersipora subatra]|uniref:U3 small nucleolar RNA-interacting protein 2-like isoform X2 n=1 Tax=Watersipora subatra TaxID=2589382 RepID=UPI00355B646B